MNISRIAKNASFLLMGAALFLNPTASSASTAPPTVEVINKKEEALKNYFVTFKEKRSGKDLKHENQEEMNELTEEITKDKGKVLQSYEYLPIMVVELTETQAEKYKNKGYIESIVEASENNDVVTDQVTDAINQKIDKNYLNDTRISELWKQGFTGKNVNIAVFDSGAGPHNEFLIKDGLHCGKVESGCTRDFSYEDGSYHGTHVSGIIVGKHNGTDANNVPLGTDGVAPDAKLYVLKAADTDTNGNEVAISSNMLNALNWAISTRADADSTNDIHIMNFSWTKIITDSEVSTYETAFNQAYNAGILIVAAAGNYDSSYYTPEAYANKIAYPARFKNVIAVTNVEQNDYTKNPNSLSSPDVSIGAPGTNIYSSVPVSTDNSSVLKEQWDGYSNSYNQLTGTSMSAPVVSGTLALLKEKYPSATNEQLKEYLAFMAKPTLGYSSTLNKKTFGKNDEFGNGFLQADVGSPINEKLTLNDTTTYLHDLPDAQFKKSESLIPQTVNAIRQGNSATYKDEDGFVSAKREFAGWYEVLTSIGPRWVKPYKFKIGEFKIALDAREELYENTNGTKTGTSIAPQIVTGVSRIGEWFEIKTWIGNKYIKPSTYYLDTFPITAMDEPVKLYASTTSTNYTQYDVGTRGFLVYEIVNDWFVVSANGERKYIKPTNYFIDNFKIKLNDPVTYLYDSTNETSKRSETLSPQTVLSSNAVKSVNGYYWFGINTWIGYKWIKPTNYTLSEN